MIEDGNARVSTCHHLRFDAGWPAGKSNAGLDGPPTVRADSSSRPLHTNLSGELGMAGELHCLGYWGLPATAARQAVRCFAQALARDMEKSFSTGISLVEKHRWAVATEATRPREDRVKDESLPSVQIGTSLANGSVGRITGASEMGRLRLTNP